MIYGLYEEQAPTLEDVESRRQHERYECTGISVSYTAFNSSYLKAVNSSVHTAKVLDISLTGLCIEADTSLSVGDTLWLTIQEPGKQNIEELYVEIMWCRSEGSGQYYVGLRVLEEDDITFDNVDVNLAPELKTPKTQNLTCPSCNETSFYMQITTDDSEPTLHTCCRCNHSHMITRVIAYNRKLS